VADLAGSCISTRRISGVRKGRDDALGMRRTGCGGQRGPPVHSPLPDDQEAEMDDRTTLSDDELITGGSSETRGQVADADQDDQDTDTTDADSDDTDADADTDDTDS
jgi:hypothetical protein